jgi:hypothetical protein
MQEPLATCFHFGFQLSLFFDPEDGGDMFLRKVGLQRTTPHYIPEDRTLHNHRCENLGSYKSPIVWVAVMF